MSKTELEPGSLFAEKYRVLAPLSEGGMGAVYVVENIHLTKELALKLMHKDLAEDETLRRRFLAEARMASRIKNGHIVDVQDVGIDSASNIPWMAMELLEGEDLKKRMRRGLPPFEEACLILKQVFTALSAAHAIPVVHRDLKPANIFLAKPNVGDAPFVVKVLDFGIAKEVTEAASTTNEAMGTPLWMAPEQTVPRADIRPSADVWALGLIVFHVLTGKLYWNSANTPGAAAAELMRQILLDPIVPGSERARELGARDHLPPGFDPWFARCVDREPKQRFQNAAQAWSVLEEVLRGADEVTVAGLAKSGRWGRPSTTGQQVGELAAGIMALAPTELGPLQQTGVTNVTPPSLPPHESPTRSGPVGAFVESQISSTGVNPGVVQVLGATQPGSLGKNGLLALVAASVALAAVVFLAVVFLRAPPDTTTPERFVTASTIASVPPVLSTAPSAAPSASASTAAEGTSGIAPAGRSSSAHLSQRPPKGNASGGGKGTKPPGGSQGVEIFR